MDEKILEARELIKKGQLDEAEKIINEVRAQREADNAQAVQTDENQSHVEPDENDEPKPADKEENGADLDEEQRALDAQKALDELENEENEVRDAMTLKKIKPVIDEGDKEIRGFADYVRGRGKTEARDVKLEGVEPIVPIDRLTNPVTLPETIVDLQNYVNVVSVSTTSGSYPILETTNAVMNTVAELVANPKLAEPTFKDVKWEVETYRGYIPMSNEAIQDSDPDLVALIAKHIARIALNTMNKAIMAELLAGFTATSLTSLDQLKVASEVTIDPAYNQRIFLSQSAFAQIDTLKDADGRYIIQPNVTLASGKSLFGKEVVVLPDAIFANPAKDKLLFLGDLTEAITLFKRTEMTVRWQDHNIYGEMLAGAVRFDVVTTNTEAGLLFKLGDIKDNISTVNVGNASEFPSGGAGA